jgi:hypothetical protein
MPWGKFRGRRLDQIPASYLVWLAEERNLTPGVEYAVRQELSRRFSYYTAPPAPAPRQDLAEQVAAWHRRLAWRHHPDRGGSTEVMQAINDAHDELRQALGL